MRKQIDKQLEINWDHSLKEGFQSFARDAGLIPATSQGEKQKKHMTHKQQAKFDAGGARGKDDRYRSLVMLKEKFPEIDAAAF